MLTPNERAFVAAYAAIGCTSVEGALSATGQMASDYAAHCKSPEVQRHLHGLFVSMEGQPAPDPFDFAPRPSITSNHGGTVYAIDPYGPLLAGWAYDHHSKRFCCGTPMSAVSPDDVEWLNTAAAWGSVDKAVKAAGG